MSNAAITPERLEAFFTWRGRVQEVVDAVACPACDAPPGQRCPPNEFGKPDIHVQRVRAYERG